jgi:hypothetical protein
MKNLLLLALPLLMLPAMASANEKCRAASQHVAVNGQVVQGMAVLCPGKDDIWRVVSFRDAQGNDLPMPGQFLYPEPPLMLTTPRTAFMPSQVIYSMPPPHVTFYEQ